jgi:hypothetical protein
MEMSDPDALYLARVEKSYPAGPRAHLRPLYQLNSSTGSWEPINEPIKAFPNRGLVTWLGADHTVTEGTLWHIRLSPYFTFVSDNPTHDQFKVTPPAQPATEILDLGDGDPDQVRRWVTEEGIDLPFVPSPHLIVRADDDLWVGPLQLVQAESPHIWILPPERRDEPLPCVVPLADDHLTHLRIDGERLFPRPGVKLGRHGQVDWSEDAVVLARVLKTDLRKLDPAMMKALELTSQAVDRTVEFLSLEHLAGVQGLLVQRRIQRAQSIIGDIERRTIGLTGLADAIQALPSVQADLSRLQEDALASVQAQVTAQETTARMRISELDAAISRAEAELLRLEEQQRHHVESTAQGFESALAERMAEVIAGPERVLADIAIFRAALGSPPTVSGTTNPARGVHPPAKTNIPSVDPLPLPWERQGHHPIPCERLEKSVAALRVMNKALKTKGVTTRAARPLLAAFLAGAMPVVAGSGALDALEASVSTIAAARLLWIPVPPGTLEPTDLLGQTDVTGIFVPRSGSLFDLLVQASEDALYTVVLDGINHAAVGSYLTPILANIEDGYGPRRVRTLSLAPPHMTAGSVLRWPSNVLVAGTLAEGVTALPLPRSLWSSAMLIHLDLLEEESFAEGEDEELTDRNEADGQASEVTPATWQTWRQEVRRQATVPCHDLFHALAAQGVTVRRDVRDRASTFYAASHWLGANEQQAVEETILYCLVPAILGYAPQSSNILASIRPGNERIARALHFAADALP